jgi:hypothetical protein
MGVRPSMSSDGNHGSRATLPRRSSLPQPQPVRTFAPRPCGGVWPLSDQQAKEVREPVPNQDDCAGTPS